jgi:alkanesulfonate monooxygenase SsuD/methylene tetrahydromethanopterin reductase-like flavin-dependent oxidoreductase (luciferase family)
LMVKVPGKFRFGLYIPNFGSAANPRTMMKLAEKAEESGWDGFYLFDHLLLWDKRVPIYDCMTTLAGCNEDGTFATWHNRVAISKE